MTTAGQTDRQTPRRRLVITLHSQSKAPQCLLCSGLLLSPSLSLALSRDHTTCPMKPGLPLLVCVTVSGLKRITEICMRVQPLQVNYHSSRHITFGFMFHRSFPICPVCISSPLSLFSSASAFPLPPLSARLCLELALPRSFSFSFLQGVCV